MKLGIIGSHCVGKTTLARYLSQALHIPTIEEQMRKSADSFSDLGFNSLEQIINSHWYSHYVFDLIKRQIEDERFHPEGFISDRTVLDYYLYYNVLSKDIMPIKEMLKTFVFQHFSSAYDVVLYIPMSTG